MRHTVATLLLLCATTLTALAAPGERTVTVEKLPASVEEFVTLRDKLATTPDGGAVIYVLAMLLYAQDPALGLPAITVATDMKYLEQDKSGKGFKGFIPWNAEQQRLRERLSGGKEYTARCYVQGTSPQGGYALPSGALSFKLREQAGAAVDASTFKIFVWCTGADSPRPITLKKNDKGLWKALEWSSLQVGPRPPVVEKKDDL